MVEAVADRHVPPPTLRYYAQRRVPGFGPTLFFDVHQVIQRLDHGLACGSGAKAYGAEECRQKPAHAAIAFRQLAVIHVLGRTDERIHLIDGFRQILRRHDVEDGASQLAVRHRRIENEPANMRQLDGGGIEILDRSKPCSLARAFCLREDLAGKMIMTVFAGIAEFERDLIRERTSAGREAAIQRGVRFGRPRKLNPDQTQLVCQLLAEGKAVREFARTFNVHEATIYRLAADT
jgi:hypothetical protein